MTVGHEHRAVGATHGQVEAHAFSALACLEEIFDLGARHRRHVVHDQIAARAMTIAPALLHVAKADVARRSYAEAIGERKASSCHPVDRSARSHARSKPGKKRSRGGNLGTVARSVRTSAG